MIKMKIVKDLKTNIEVDNSLDKKIKGVIPFSKKMVVVVYGSNY